MNDPHVAALYYRVRHNETVKYSRATTLTFDEDLFEVEVKDGVARFGLKRHCVSVFKQMGQMFGLAKGVFCASFSCYAACR